MAKRKAEGVDDIFAPPKEEAIEPMEESGDDMPDGEGKNKDKDIVSAWIKSLRLGLWEESVYWLWVMTDTYGQYYTARRMAVFAGEDCWDAQAIVLTSALLTMIEKKVPDTFNHIMYVNAYLCKCPKFWNTEEGVERYRIAEKVRRRIVKSKDGEIIPEAIPKWAIDLHTRRGNEFAAKGEWKEIDRRFGGDMVGVYTRILMQMKHGRLHIDDGDAEYWSAMKKVKALQEAEAQKEVDDEKGIGA